MTQKSRIINALGEDRLLLPSLVNEALAANDRAKYFFALLQAAQARAEAPQQVSSDLHGERTVAGVKQAELDTAVAASEVLAGNYYRIPYVGQICAAIDGELERMIAPLQSVGSAYASFAPRLAALRSLSWCDGAETMTREQLTLVTSGDRERGDSPHLLVMDMHKALNALQARIAEETIDGAHCYAITEADRDLIAAFMAGVRQTAPLKLDHPGLGTTATRVDAALVLQNDIGTTDAHVLVVHVLPQRVTVTYTDVHLQRLLFFQSLFEQWDIEWEDTRSRTDRTMEDGLYHLSVGVFETPGKPADFLRFLGSRLVFLIDWNRARKRLRLMLPKKETLALLKWTADENYGHMAFLHVDAPHVIFDALGFVAQGISPETRLDDLLGREQTLQYMKFVLRVCTEAMLHSRPVALVHDEIRAELVSCVRSTQQNLIDAAAEQAALANEIAAGVRDSLVHAHESDAAERFARNAARAKQWEHEADELVNRARGMVRLAEGNRFYQSLIENADDVCDDLEEAAFDLTLLAADGGRSELLAALTSLAAVVASGTQEYVKALETVRSLRRGGPREDVQDFLEAVHQIVRFEHESDAAHRAVKAALVKEDSDCRRLYAVAECGRSLEAAADGLMHSAMMLRDYVLNEVLHAF